MSYENLPCQLCHAPIDSGRLCDRCLGLEQHRNVLNGVTAKEGIMSEPFYGEIVVCKECNEDFAPWKNGANMQRKTCQPCMVAKRKATLQANLERKRAIPESEPEYGGPGDWLLQPMPMVLDEPKPTEPSDNVVSFRGEPELTGKIAAMATRERRTFHQQVLWILEWAFPRIGKEF